MVFLGLDIGTTNTKAVLLDSDGNLLGCLTLSSGSEEKRNAMTWYEHFCKAMDYFQSKGHLRGQKISCSITAQGGTFVLLDKKFKPVTQVYSWTQNADETIARELSQSFDSSWYYHTTGWEPNRWLAACKFKQLINENKAPKDYRFFSTVPEFVYSQLTGEFVTDITNAQITGICSFESSRWDANIIEWLNLKAENLPAIATKIKILFDEAAGRWGKMNFVTSSHDQYAAMQAASLEPDKNVLLGTGTAWVVNSRSHKPLFDDDNYLTHPGRELLKGYYGNIIGLGSIGAGFDKLLARVGITKAQLAEIETDFRDDDFPKCPLQIDIQAGNVDIEADWETTVRRYMECAGSLVAFMLERFKISENLNRIIMSGGAVGSRFWPQVIADLCEKTVEAVDFPEFTAYGAALYAKLAVEAKQSGGRLCQLNKSRIYEPSNASVYRQWYNQHQKAIIEQSLLT